MQTLKMAKDQHKMVKMKEGTGMPACKIDILPHFWNLASLEESCRVKAVEALIRDLSKIKNGQSDEETSISEEMSYTLKRLVRGLASGRKGARQGFATALLEIVSEVPELTMTKVFGCLNEDLKVSRSMKGMEEGNVYFGQIFCYAVVLQACIRNTLADLMIQDEIPALSSVKRLVFIMGKKSYLRELCAKVICDVIEKERSYHLKALRNLVSKDWSDTSFLFTQRRKEPFTMKVDYQFFQTNLLPGLEELLNGGWKACIPESLMIAHKTEVCFKDQLEEKFFKKAWKHLSILSPKNFKRMVKPLMESTLYSHPRVHTVWLQILPCVLSHRDGLPLFWKEVIEDGLLSSTHERKYLAFQLLVLSLPMVATDQVPVIFSPTLVKSIVNNCAVKDNFLHSAAKTMLTSLVKEIEHLKDSPKALQVIFQIIQRYGIINFDYVTKTNTVENLITKLDTPALDILFNWFVESFNTGRIQKDGDAKPTEESLFENLRVLNPTHCQEGIVTLMFSMVKSHAEPKPEDILIKVAKFFFLHGHFTVVKMTKKDQLLSSPCEHAPEESVRTLCQHRFQSTLAEIAGNDRAVKDQDSFGSRLVKFAEWLIDHPKYVQMERPWTPEVFTIFRRGLETLERVRAEPTQGEASGAFKLLLLHAVLQLFGNSEEAVDILEEVLMCYEKSCGQGTKGEEEPHWTEVIAEVLLSFQAQSSHLMRQVTDRAFQYILPHLTVKALEIIIEAVKGKKGPDLAFEEDEEDEEDDEFEPIDRNEEAVNGGAAESDGESEEEETEESDETSEKIEKEQEGESAVMEVEVDEKFRSDVEAALAKAHGNEGEEEKEDDSSDESIDMDTVEPSSLEAMDKALGAVFKTRTKANTRKRQKQAEKKSVIHFRLRVLDFLEILIKKQPKSALVLELPTSMLEVIAGCASKDETALKERAVSLLKNKLCRLHVYPTGNDLDSDYVNGKIAQLIDMAETVPSDYMAQLVTGGVAYFIRVLRGVEHVVPEAPERTLKRKRKSIAEDHLHEADKTSRLNLSRVGVSLGRCLKNFMLRKKCQARPVLFSEIISRFPHLAWTMNVDLARHCSTAINTYRKTQAWGLAFQLLSRKTESFPQLLQEMSSPLEKSINQVLRLVTQEDCKIKAKQLVGFVKLVEKFLVESCKVPQVWESIQKLELIENISAASMGPVVSRSTQLQASFRRLLSCAQGDHPSSKAQKTKKTTSQQKSATLRKEGDQDIKVSQDQPHSKTKKKLAAVKKKRKSGVA